MKLYQTLGLATAGIAWLTTVASAQRVTTNPTAVPNTVSTPTFQPDTLRPSREQILNDNTAGQDDADRKNKRERKRALRRNNRSDENTRMNKNGNSSTDSSASAAPRTDRQDGAYRQGSVSSGTTNNNSNTTNYNSSSVMTAPTGAGSNPSATGAAGDVRPGTTATEGSMASSSSAPATAPNLNKTGATATGSAVAGADNAPIVNPSARTRSTSVSDFLASQPDFSTLQNAVQVAELADALKGGQAYTVFAPANDAFKKLPTQTQNVLLEGRNRESLKKLLSYHVVQGTVDANELTRQINAGKGQAKLKTLGGGTLTAKLGTDGRVALTDEQGHVAHVTQPDQAQANGVVHGIDAVLMPAASGLSFK